MRIARPFAFPLLPLALLAMALAACAPAPIYKTAAGQAAATPTEVAAAPANFSSAQVVWGGSVIAVHNLADRSEIEILAYPLDSSQRPRLKQPALGRFIALVPDFVEPMDYPAGALVTLQGTVAGTRRGVVGQAGYTFALVHSEALHRWSADELQKGHPNISIGVGVGGWIH